MLSSIYNYLGMSSWKPGDWKCKCGCHNFANRTSCRDCGKAKSKGKGGGKFNDWICGNCGNDVFGSKSVCGLCKVGKRDGSSLNTNEIQKKGDWICSHCNKLCFAFRDVCNSCHIGSRPKSDGSDKQEKKKGDWNCAKCGELNFANRNACFKCFEPNSNLSSNIGADILKAIKEEQKKLEKLQEKQETLDLKSTDIYPNYWIVESQTDMKFHLCDDKKVKKIQKLCDKTVISDFIGQGRDNYGLSHKSYQIQKVYRVENPNLYKKYIQHKKNVKDNEMFGADVYNKNESKIKHFDKHLDQDANEMWLWHGTKPEIKDIIPVSGFDERVASSGLFGHGIYFAENFSKSDEYTRPSSDGTCYMFLTRVCMGNICHITEGQSGRKRPPCVREFVGRCNGVCTHPRHHSLLAEKGQNCYLKKYREFIVYDRNQCYPEYLIEYKRI